MKRIIETPVSLEELEEIRRQSRAEVSLELLEVVMQNKIPLNRIVMEGEGGEIKKFMEFLMRKIG
ncbi:TIGR04140 family protein, partial [Thermococcus sp. GR7]|uniref:TIGR04140 family protein n=1 Tax=Thermococcus sp. GR7 TaxID=1638257 RepID=UPI00143110B6